MIAVKHVEMGRKLYNVMVGALVTSCICRMSNNIYISQLLNAKNQCYGFNICKADNRNMLRPEKKMSALKGL